MARWQQDQREKAYRIYLSDALRIISENTAKTVGYLSRGTGEAAFLTRRYIELIEPAQNGTPSTSPEEGHNRILRKLME